MSLSAGLQTYTDDLTQIFQQVGSLITVPIKAHQVAQATHTFLLSGIPMTVLTFSSPTITTGTGLGGLDIPTPGIGLAAALPTLQTDLLAAWTHHNVPSTARIFAQKTATAVYNYYRQAIVQTIDTAPPNMGVSAGTGGLLTPAPGSGLAAAQPAFESALVAQWTRIGVPGITTLQESIDFSQALHTFATQAMVVTAGNRTGTTGTATGTIS
jgi:hypothetical protein